MASHARAAARHAARDGAAAAALSSALNAPLSYASVTASFGARDASVPQSRACARLANSGCGHLLRVVPLAFPRPTVS